MTNVAHWFFLSHLPRKCSTKSVNLWSGSTSWGTTPTRPATIPPSRRCQGGLAAASGGPALSASGTFPLTAKAGHGEASRLEARTKPRSSCPGCWETRTMRWWGGWETVRAHTTTRITTAAEVTAADADTAPGKAGADAQMTEQTFRWELTTWPSDSSKHASLISAHTAAWLQWRMWENGLDPALWISTSFCCWCTEKKNL